MVKLAGETEEKRRRPETISFERREAGQEADGLKVMQQRVIDRGLTHNIGAPPLLALSRFDLSLSLDREQGVLEVVFVLRFPRLALHGRYLWTHGTPGTPGTHGPHAMRDIEHTVSSATSAAAV